MSSKEEPVPLNVKNEEAHRMARELAELTGQSITTAVTQAVQDALDRARRRDQATTSRLTRDLDEIALHCASLPVRDSRSSQEILGYDQHGLPS